MKRPKLTFGTVFYWGSAVGCGVVLALILTLLCPVQAQTTLQDAARAQNAATREVVAALDRLSALIPAPPRISVLDGPDSCSPVLRPDGQIHLGAHLCTSGPQVPPALGGSWRDSNFGGISIAQTPPGTPYFHGYGLPTPLSATNRYLYVMDNGGRHWAVDRANGYQRIFVPGSAATTMWHPTDDDVFWWLSGPKIMAHHIAANTDTVTVDFTGIISQPNNGGSVHNSADGWTTVWSAPEHKLCAVDLLKGKPYCADYLAAAAVARVGIDFIDFTGTTEVDAGSGKRYAILIATPSMSVWSVDMAAGKLVFEFRGPEWPVDQGFGGGGNHNDVCDNGDACIGAPHGDLTSINGVQYFVAVADTNSTPCQRDLAAYPIAAGVRMIRDRVTIATLGYCSSQYEWTDIDIGCSGLTGACAISTYSNAQPAKPGPYAGSVMLMQDLTHLIKLGFHKSQRSGSDTYWFQPRAAISRDGRYIVYDSNLGQADAGDGSSHEQVFLMRTR